MKPCQVFETFAKTVNSKPANILDNILNSISTFVVKPLVFVPTFFQKLSIQFYFQNNSSVSRYKLFERFIQVLKKINFFLKNVSYCRYFTLGLCQRTTRFDRHNLVFIALKLFKYVVVFYKLYFSFEQFLKKYGFLSYLIYQLKCIYDFLLKIYSSIDS